jgi:ABC-type sugar transport system permease subunit
MPDTAAIGARRSRLQALKGGPAIAGPLGWLVYLLPAFVLTGLFVLYPAIGSVRLSFFSWPGYGPKQSVGLRNFKDLLADANLRGAAFHSLEFALITTVLCVGVGTAIALALDRKIRGHRVFQFIIFLPVILPSTFIALAWANGYDPYFGWATQVLSVFGLSHNWLADPQTTILALALPYVLQSVGLPMIIVLAALGEIPSEIHEAATLDGVSAVRRARSISLPLVRDAVSTVALLLFIWGYTNFEFSFIMSNGGPGSSGDMVGTFVYDEAFQRQRFGYAAAAAIVTSVILAIAAMIYLTIFRPRGIQRAG